MIMLTVLISLVGIAIAAVLGEFQQCAGHIFLTTRFRNNNSSNYYCRCSSRGVCVLQPFPVLFVALGLRGTSH